jgi:hypothetical protein
LLLGPCCDCPFPILKFYKYVIVVEGGTNVALEIRSPALKSCCHWEAN